MNIDEIKKQFKNEWVLIEITKADQSGNLLEGNVIAHSISRDETYSEMKKTVARNIAHFYTGEIPKKGYAVAF